MPDVIRGVVIRNLVRDVLESLFPLLHHIRSRRPSRVGQNEETAAPITP
jgi:hypothetical protein